MRLPHICVNNIRIFRASRPGTFVGCVIFAIVENALERLHLKPYSLRYADELSGGELQKVIIARALIRYGYFINGTIDKGIHALAVPGGVILYGILAEL